MPSRRALAIAAAVLLVVGIVLVGRATRPSEDRVALAIHKATRLDTGVVIYEVECAKDIEPDFSANAETQGDDGLGEITLWGTPVNGRCTSTYGDPDQGADAFVDGATSQVVHIGGRTMAQLSEHRREQRGG